MCVVLGVSRPPGSIYCLQCVRMGVEKAGGGKEIVIGGDLYKFSYFHNEHYY